MPVAFNKETGELLTLGQDGQWGKPQMAQNEKGAKVFLDGDAWKPVPASGEDQTSWYERGMRGLGDVAQGVAQLGSRMPNPFVIGKERQEKYAAQPAAVDTEIRDTNRTYDERRGQNRDSFDPMRLTGNVIGTLPAAMLLPAGTGLAGAAGMGALTGGLTGAASPVVDNQESFWTEKAKQAGIGAATGGAAGVGSNIVGRFINPSVSPEIQQLIDKGVTPPPGQILGGAAKRAEDAVGIGSRSGVAGEYTTAAINDALAPLGVTLPKGIAPGQAAVQEAKNLVSKAYDDVWSAQHRVGLDSKAADELTGIMRQAVDRFKKPELIDEFQSLVEQGLGNVKGAVTADKVRAAVDSLRETADDYIRAGGPQATMGRLLKRVADSTEEAAVRSNPTLAAAKSAADKAYAGMTRVFDASSKDVAEGLITPRTLAAAVKSGAPSDSMVATGQGLLQPLAAAGLKALPPTVNSVAPYAIGAGIGGAGLGASALTGDPKYAAGAGALGLLYTPAGRRAFATVMTQRPEYAKAIAAALREATPYISGGAANAASQR